MIRPYQPADAAATLSVFTRAIRQTATAFYTTEQIAAWAPVDIELDRWNAGRARAWTVLAEVDGRVVGFADLVDGELLDMLFVDPDAAGQGVARALVETVVAQAHLIRSTRVVTHASRVARPVFERLGFTVDAENLDNQIRGVAVPNFDMHIEL